MIIRAAPDPALARSGADLWHEAVVSVPEAVLGATITVPSLEGNVTVSVPPGTQPVPCWRWRARACPATARRDGAA